MIETLGSLALAAGHDLQKRDDPGAVPGSSLENPRTPLDKIFAVQESYTGKRVTEINSLQLAAVWRCVSIIAGAIARTPLVTFHRTDEGRTIARDHYSWGLFNLQANPFMTAYRWRRIMQTWVLLWGNAFAEIQTNGRGQVIALWPWRPDRVRISGLGPSLRYQYTLQDGTQLPSVSYQYILHMRGLETDGIVGLNPIRSARQSLGLAMAAEEYGARFFSNNGRPGGVLEHPGLLSKQAEKNLRESYEDLHRGLRGAHRMAILEEGMKYQEVGIPPEEMQFLQTRQFQAIDIARLFGVPPHMIAELSRATFSNIEHQSIDFVNSCLDDWFVNWESELTNSLLSDREASSIEFEFMRRRLLRGDQKTRFEGYNIGILSGMLNPNEAREEEGLNKVEGLDYFTRPLNMAPVVSDDVPPVDPEDAEGDDAPADVVPAVVVPGVSPTTKKKTKKEPVNA